MGAADLVSAVGEQLRPLRRTEYDHLVGAGAFAGERLELLEGVLVEMSPQDPAHSELVFRLQETISHVLGSGLQLRVQMPLALGAVSEPQPDLAVVRRASYLHAHPDHALLVVEVARTSQRLDLGGKAAIYAAAAVPEYWVVDFPERAVHVHHEPVAGRYAIVTVVAGHTLSATTVPGIAVDLDTVFAD